MYKPRIPALTDVTVCCDKSFEEFTNVMLPPRFFLSNVVQVLFIGVFLHVVKVDDFPSARLDLISHFGYTRI